MFDLTKTWATTLWSIFAAIIAALITFPLNPTICVPISALTFAVVGKVLDSQKNKTLDELRQNEFTELKKIHEKDRLKILTKVARDQIHLVRLMIIRENISAIISSFSSLEFIVTEISKCCNTENNRNKFRIVKGMISDTKTTFDKSQKDHSIVKPFAIATTSINNLESYLNDL